VTDARDPTPDIPRVYLPTRYIHSYYIRHKGCQPVSPHPPASFLSQDLYLPLASPCETSPTRIIRQTTTPRRCWIQTTRSGHGVHLILQPRTSRCGAIQVTLRSSLPTRKTRYRSSYGSHTTRALGGDPARESEAGRTKRSATRPKTTYIARIPTLESTRRPSRYRSLRPGRLVGRRRFSLSS